MDLYSRLCAPVLRHRLPLPFNLSGFYGFVFQQEACVVKGRAGNAQRQAAERLFGKEFYEVEQILKATGREGKFDFLKKIMLILFAGGVVLALLLNNAYMIPVFGIGLGLAPLWYIRATSAKYKRRLNEDLETALSIVTTSYLRTEDIRQAVRENLEYMTDPVKTYFQEFVIEIDLINANIISALNTLKMKIPNAIFHEWVDTLVTCQSDRNMKHTLTNTVQKFSDVRIVQGELDAMLAEPRRGGHYHDVPSGVQHSAAVRSQQRLVSILVVYHAGQDRIGNLRGHYPAGDGPHH